MLPGPALSALTIIKKWVVIMGSLGHKPVSVTEINQIHTLKVMTEHIKNWKLVRPENIFLFE
jgi:hypothetical protein